MAVIDGMWHSTMMGPSYDDLLRPLRELFGASVMHFQTSEDPEIGRDGGMIWLGDNSIEIGAPRGPVSPVRKFVERMGGGMHSMALRVPDKRALVDLRERLTGLGMEAFADIGDEVFFTRPAGSGGLLLEWSAMQTDDDPRFGHPLPEQSALAAAPLAPVTRYGFVTAAVAEPVALAERLAELFATDVVRRVPGAGPGEIGAMVSLVDCLLVLFVLPASAAEWPWPQPPARARLHGHGLEVDDLPAALATLEAAGVGVVARLEHAVLLDPEATTVPTFLSDHGFAEDPRRG